MELILREDVDKLGRRGDVVKVADGYGRNKAMIEKEKKANEARLAKEKAEFESLAGRIAGLRFIAPRKVGENEQLYGSVTSGDVGEFLRSKGIEIDKRKVQLEEAIKQLGEHEVKIRLHPEVVASLKLLVTKEG